VAGTISDETVRRYYRQDFAARLRAMFAPPEIFSPRRRGFEARPRRGAPARHTSPPALFGREPYVAASPQLAASPLHRGHRAAIPRREALILQAALNHPWLLHDHLEELAAAEFRHADSQKLKGALIDVFAHLAEEFRQERKQEREQDRDAERTELHAELTRRGFANVLGRIERAITTPSVWGARPGAAADDVLLTWRQLVALHTQWHSLIRELKDAEAALGQDNTEANYARLCDVKARLSTLDGTEALVEGFGAASGRSSRSL
jgi:DNA primase